MRVIAMTVAGALCAGVVSAGTLTFTDRTTPSGITALQIPCCYSFGTHMLGGGAAGDFNRDGLQDMFVIVGGNQPDRLYINNGDGTFTDQAAAWGITTAQNSSGVAVGDYDGNGWLDVYVTCHGNQTVGWAPHQNRLYRNNGDNTFTEVAAIAGVRSTSPFVGDGFGAAFGDYDLDGDLDLAVTGWLNNSQGNRLFQNNGDGTFTDVTTTAILHDLTPVRGFAPRFTDMDGDRYPELLWVGDFFTSRYLVNNGNGTFTEMTAASGTGLDSNGMGNAAGDFNGDGLIDWYVSSILEELDPMREGNMLYINQGNHVFVESGKAAGVDDGGWGWGVTAIDFDHDTHVDIAETNGWASEAEWIGENSKLFMNNGDMTFTESSAATNFDHTGYGRGLFNFDYDNDGDQDVVICGTMETVRLFRNDLTGPDTNYLRVFFDTSAHSDLAPDGFGTRITITVNGKSQVRYLDGGSNYLAVSELSAHFGVGEQTVIDEVLVEWSNGRFTRRTNVAANQTMTIVACLHPGDGNGDETVDFVDLNLVLNSWGQSTMPFQGGDMDGDGDVDFDDINLVLGGWGLTCP